MGDAAAKSKLDDWQNALTEWMAKKGGPNQSEQVLISVRNRWKREIVQDFYSRLNAPIESPGILEFGFHVEDCYAVTPKDDLHGGRPCIMWKGHRGECVCGEVSWRQAWTTRADERFMFYEIMLECEDSQYGAERAKAAHTRFDKLDFLESATLTRRDCYQKAKDLFRLLVPAPHMSDPCPAGDRQQPKDSDDDQDDQDQDDPGDEEKTEEADEAQRKTGPSSSPWEDWTGGAASGSWNSSSWQWQTTLVACLRVFID